MILGMLTLSLVSIIGVSIVDLSTFSLRSGRFLKIDSAAAHMQKSIVMSIYDDSVWSDSIAAQSQCLKEGKNCPNDGVLRPLLVRQLDGTVLAGDANGTIGFTQRGELCDSFNINAGNSQCPARFEVSWTPTACNAGTCEIQVVGTLIYRPGDADRVTFRSARYDFNFVRGREDGSLRQACIANQGIFNQATSECGLDVAVNAKCPDGQFATRISNSGQISCVPVISSNDVCPQGSGPVGFLSNGRLDCRSHSEWK